MKFDMETSIVDACGTLNDFGAEWGFPKLTYQEFEKIVKSTPVTYLSPEQLSHMEFNNTVANLELLGKGMDDKATIDNLGMAGIEQGRQYSAYDSVSFHFNRINQGVEVPLIFVKNRNGSLTLLDGDHRLVAHTLASKRLPIIAIGL